MPRVPIVGEVVKVLRDGPDDHRFEVELVEWHFREGKVIQVWVELVERLRKRD